MERNSAALSFAKHENGIIYVGGQNDFGYLKRDSLMRRSYTSLAHLVPDSAANIAEVEFTYVVDNKVHFISRNWWYIYADDEISAYRNSPIISSALQWKTSIIYVDANGRMAQFKDGATTQLPAAATTAKPLRLTSSGDRLFMLDQNFIFWEWNGSGAWTRLYSLSKELTKASVIVKDILWSNAGYIHISTSNGLFTYNQKGEFIHTIYDSDGLCDNDLTRLYEDDALNIWVSSNFGISVLEYGRPLREFLPSAHQFPEYARTLKNYNGKLYVGANSGLYVWEAGKFRQLFNDRQVFTFELMPYGLLLGTSTGLELLNDRGIIKPLFTGGRVDLILADREHSEVVYYSHDAVALRKIRFTSPDKYSDTKLVDFKEAGYTITEDSNGDLWIGTGRKGDFHFKGVQEDSVILSIGEVRQFTTEDGLPTNGFNYTMQVGKDVGFITSDGFYTLSADRDSIIADHRFDQVFTGQDRAIWPVVQDKNGGIWLAWAAAHIGKAVYNPETNIFDWYDGEYTRTAPYRDIDFIYPASNHRIYFQTFTQKLAYFDSLLYRQPLPEFKAHITSVIINSDSLLSEPRGLSDTMLQTPIFYKDNKIRFNYGMIAFLPEDRLFYEIKLDGLDEEWSQNTNERYQDYTNLKEGKYTFRVRGFTLYPYKVKEASFTFQILPPWYRSWLAYLSYLLIGFSSLFLFVRFREKRLLDRQEELEQEIENRTEEIRIQKEQLEIADKVKSRLFANISHEFRTPLTISDGLITKMLRSKDQKPADHRHDLSIVKRNLQRLNDMVNQIIDLTKSDQNHLTLHRKYYKADTLALISVESFRSLAEYHGHRFEFYPSAGDTVLYADRPKVEIMINNLISNAIKFTPDAGTIEIHTAVEEGMFILEVMDTGPGIPDGQEELIFERFHRITREDADYVEGMGIGLELSRVLARLHGGELATVKGKATGACFRLSLPCAGVNGNEVTLVPDVPEEKWVTSPLYEEFEHSSLFDILLVEDNEDMRNYVSDILGEVGTIRKVRNGKEALEMLNHYTPDIIITDLMMPIMGGEELVKSLFKHEQWKQIPVIVLTAKALEEDKLNLLRIGVVDYITKPFLPEQLILKTKNLLTYYTRRKKMKLSVKAEKVHSESEFLKRITAFVTTNISDSNLSVDAMAEEFSQSRRSLYRNLQVETGMTPAEFIREIRLTTAQAMVVSNKNMRLEELAFAVGYKSVTSFRKMYETRFGKHPLG